MYVFVYLFEIRLSNRTRNVLEKREDIYLIVRVYSFERPDGRDFSIFTDARLGNARI